MKALIKAVLVMVAFALSADMDPDSHAPIGVMGDHYHKAGELMLSYRFMHMSMRDNLDGRKMISPETIVTSSPNEFAGFPMMPATLRVTPTKMTMQMHMLGMMYAPNDRVTFMGMINQISKKMSHVTFSGPMGTTRLGTFETKTSGIGDINIGGLFKLYETAQSRWHINAGLSIPTGSIQKQGSILTPMNARPRVRLPYPMQMGSGTFDLTMGLTHARKWETWGWGSQWMSFIRLNKNTEDYSLGNEHKFNTWLSYQLSDRLSVSTRATLMYQGEIKGRDQTIIAPVQTADPDRHGGQRLDIAFGLNVVLPTKRVRIAMEILTPPFQNLNGPQLATDWSITLGTQFIP